MSQLPWTSGEPPRTRVGLQEKRRQWTARLHGIRPPFPQQKYMESAIVHALFLFSPFLSQDEGYLTHKTGIHKHEDTFRLSIFLSPTWSPDSNIGAWSSSKQTSNPPKTQPVKSYRFPVTSFRLYF